MTANDGSPGVERKRGPGGSQLVARLAALVPESRRAEWLAEWRAELEHAQASRRSAGDGRVRTAVALNVRALGALRDALWLRRNEGGPGVHAFGFGRPFRLLRRQPGFSMSVVVTLAIGIGAATAIFTVVDGLLLRPVPFAAAERLVEVQAKRGDYASQDLDAEVAAVWREQGTVFEEVRAHGGRPFTLTGEGEPRFVRAAQLEPGFLSMLGLSPVLGRAFLPEETIPGRNRVVLLGHDLWRGGFGGDAGVVGRTIRLNDDAYTVVGVLPRELRILPGGLLDMAVPLADTVKTVSLIARLPGAASIASASERLAGVAAILEVERPREGGWGVQLEPLQNLRIRGVREALLVLSGAVGLLLAIACANAAGLLFLHGAGRQQEFAIRRALGGTRGGLIAQLVAESLGLAMLAGALGILLAWWCVKGVVGFMPDTLTRWNYTPIRLDARVLGFALLTTVAVGVAFGVLPALRSTGVSRSLASAGRWATAGRAQRKLRGTLVVFELALAVVLLAGAGLLGHSLLRLIAVDAGFRSEGLIVATLSLPGGRYETAEGRVAFRQRLEEAVRGVPGVTGVSQSLGGVPPQSNLMFGMRLETAEGYVPPNQPETLPYGSVDTAFFSVLGIPIVEGRGFRADDAPAELGHVIVDRDLARFLWPDVSAVGRRFRRGSDAPWLTVVGVAGSVQLTGPGGRDGEFELYFPGGQGSSGGYFTLAVRAGGEAASAIATLRRTIRALDPDLPILELTSAEAHYRDALAMPRFLSWVLISFAGVALLLASVGMYALISYDIARRTREIGVRVALGARGSRIVGDVFASGMLLVAAGIALGLAGALALGQLVRGLLFGIAPSDPVTLAFAVAVLVAACALALLLPARRAAGVAPMEALRVE